MPGETLGTRRNASPWPSKSKPKPAISSNRAQPDWRTNANHSWRVWLWASALGLPSGRPGAGSFGTFRRTVWRASSRIGGLRSETPTSFLATRAEACGSPKGATRRLSRDGWNGPNGIDSGSASDTPRGECIQSLYYTSSIMYTIMCVCASESKQSQGYLFLCSLIIFMPCFLSYRILLYAILFRLVWLVGVLLRGTFQCTAIPKVFNPSLTGWGAGTILGAKCTHQEWIAAFMIGWFGSEHYWKYLFGCRGPPFAEPGFTGIPVFITKVRNVRL